jgi:hypothetical protein
MNLNDLGIVASVASLVLAILAIWLSVQFYRMSVTMAEKSIEAAKGISSSVERLEKLFDRLYSDTFSMMRDTVTDMRRHMWPEELPTEPGEVQAAETEMTRVRQQVAQELDEVMSRMGATDARMEAIRDETQELVQRAISESRLVDARLEARLSQEPTISSSSVLDSVISLMRVHSPLAAREVTEFWDRRGQSPHVVITRLRQLKADGHLAWDDDRLGPSTILRLAAGDAQPTAS